MARFLLCRLMRVEFNPAPWLGALDGFTDAACLCLAVKFLIG